MGKALEFQPIIERREFYQLEGIQTKNDCAVLSQLVYWANVSGFNEFYKTDEELSEETKVSVHSIRRVKKKLKSLSFVIMTRRGVPAKTYYEIDPYKILEETASPCIEQCLSEQSSKTLKPQKTQITQIAQSRLSKMHKQDYANCSNKITQIAQSIYRTKNTSETTTENTTKKKENTAIAQIEHEHECEHEREFSEAKFEDEYEHEDELKHEREHECEEQVLPLSDESCAFVECRNDLTQPEHEEDQEALKAEEIISTLQSESLTETRDTKEGHRIPQSKSIATRSAEEHDEPVGHDKPSMPQSNPKASRSRKNHDEPTSHDEFHISQSNPIPKSSSQASESVLPDYILQSNTRISPKSRVQRAEFEEWYKLYDNPKDKKKADNAYIKVRKRINHAELMKRTQKFLDTRAADLKRIGWVPTKKYPATWLNEDCWDAEDLRDTSTPQEKHQTALDEIRAKYRGQEAMVREQLFKNLGNPYFVYLSDAQIFFDHKTAHVLVDGPTDQDELRGSYSSQVKNAFKHVEVEHLIIKNIKQNSPDVSLMI